jgi:hypothetical protein
LIVRPATGLTIQSTFESGLDGWTAVLISTTWQSTGGNPGGFLRGVDQPLTSYLRAPAAFLGDLSAFNGGYLSFDHIALDTGGEPIAGLGGTVEIYSGSQVASADLLTPVTSWQTGSAPLTATAWGVSPATWTSLLSNVTEIRVIVDSTQSGGNVDGFDNFTMVTPEPGTVLLLAAGVACFGYARRRRGN